MYQPRKATPITVAEDSETGEIKVYASSEEVTGPINFKLYPELRIDPDYFQRNPGAQKLRITGTLSYEKRTNSGAKRTLSKMDGQSGMPTEMTFTSYEFHGDEVVDNVIFKAGDIFAIVPDPINAADFMVFHIFLNDQLGFYEAVALVADTSNTKGLTLNYWTLLAGARAALMFLLHRWKTP